MTSNPEAFAAWVRGVAAWDAVAYGPSTEGMKRAAAEFETAVALDSTFAEAWGELAAVYYALAIFTTVDRDSEARTRATIDRALVHAPGQPRVLLALAGLRSDYDHDTTSADTLIARALSAAPNDPVVLRQASLSLFYMRQRADSGYALAKRVVALDPRSMRTLVVAANLALMLRRWDDARRYSDASVALDSTDSRGWSALLETTFYLGDTTALRRDLDRALAHVSRPDITVLGYMPYIGGAYGSRYLALSARELAVTTVYDSAWYYSIKADVFHLRREPAGARVYYDSIRTVLGSRPLSGPNAPLLLMFRALAEAGVGDTAVARRTLVTALAAGRRVALRADLTGVISPYIAAAVYARLGESETAVRWLAAGLANPSGGHTARRYAAEPSLLVLRGTPAFERFLREHPR